MGCVSSNLLNIDGDFRQMGGSGSGGLGHHIVSLTSTTYGLLTLDPPPSDQSPTLLPSPLSEPPEVINSWELMAGLDGTSSSRFPLPPLDKSSVLLSDVVSRPPASVLDGFEKLCPPMGENRAVIYTTTLRGVRKTFEACNAVRAAMEGVGVMVCERDISMDRGFREELRELMKGRESVPPRVFLKGRYVGGAEEVMKMVEDGRLGELVQGLPKLRAVMCDGCGGVRFLPCFTCNGSCKIVMKQQGGVRRCSDCNENGLVLCPICS